VLMPYLDGSIAYLGSLRALFPFFLVSGPIMISLFMREDLGLLSFMFRPPLIWIPFKQLYSLFGASSRQGRQGFASQQ